MIFTIFDIQDTAFKNLTSISELTGTDDSEFKLVPLIFRGKSAELNLLLDTSRLTSAAVRLHIQIQTSNSTTVLSRQAKNFSQKE